MNEILTPKEMAEADRRTIAAGTSGIVLMARAGAAVADAVARRLDRGGSVAVVCGPGNNGGDGFIAAHLLREQGYKVRLSLAGEESALKGDAALAAERWNGAIERFDIGAMSKNDLIIDALFGAGLSRDLKGEALVAIQAITSSNRPVIAVDLPSGIDGETGQVRGAAAHAAETITFCRMKPGHLLLPGRLYAGKVTVADIGIGDGAVVATGSTLSRNVPSTWLPAFPWPTIDGHKYDRGHAVVVSGPAHATGAARLAANAALRAGAGLVTVAAPKAALPVLAASLTAVMVREASGPTGLKKFLTDARLRAVLLGPGQGAGKATRDSIEVVAKLQRTMVLDADAISSFTGESEKLAKLLKSNPNLAVVTPHEGEFMRLFARDLQTLAPESKVERVRAAARVLGAVVLLKGADTVVAAPDGRATIADNAPPWLATAGSGDVLSGIILGLIAQGMPAFEAASAGAWLHGEAAIQAGFGMISEDLGPALRSVLACLHLLHGPHNAGAI